MLDHADQLSPRTRARALAGAGLVAWDRGDVAEARTLSIASADLLDDEQLGSLRAYVLAGTAVTAIDDPELRDWAVGCVRMGPRLMAAWCVGELAISADGLGEHELAARLIGAGTRAMETLHAGRYPADVAEDEQVVDSLVDRLGQDEFDRLVAEGRALTLDDAISLALEG